MMKEQQADKEKEVKPQAAPAAPAVKARVWKRWLNYQSVVRQVPFFLFLALLAVVYIYNGHYADKVSRNIDKTTREVRELQHEYKTVKGKVMGLSKRSEMVKAVKEYGLKELTESPVVLTPAGTDE